MGTFSLLFVYNCHECPSDSVEIFPGECGKLLGLIKVSMGTISILVRVRHANCNLIML